MRYIRPPKITKVLSPEEFKESWFEAYNYNNYYVQPKIDGARHMLYVGRHSIKLLSRCVSKKTHDYVDNTDKFFIFNNTVMQDWLCSNFPNSIFDGELSYGKTSSELTKIIGCTTEKAIERQIGSGEALKYYIFDMPYFLGTDLTDLPYAKRLEGLTKSFFAQKFKGDMLFCQSEQTGIYAMPTYPGIGAIKKYDEITQNGGEGVVLKEKTAVYGKGVIKVKKDVTIDVVLMGFEFGTGRNSNVAATLYYGYWDEKNLGCVQLGRVSGFSDELKSDIAKNWDTYCCKIMELKGQEVLKSGALRHPRFLRFREDKVKEECTVESVLNLRKEG